jgi:uncharacterized protein
VRSIYTFTVKGDFGLYLYNSFTGAFLCFDEASSKHLEIILNNEHDIDSIDNHQELLKTFYDHGFLTHSHSSEIEKINRRRHDVYDTNQIDSRSFVIGLTLDCNLRYSYCYQESSRKNNKHPLTDRTQERLVDFIKRDYENGIKRINITWFGGEPLLELEVIKKLTSKITGIVGSDKYSSGMISNGYMLNNSNIKLLKEMKCNDLQITIDGSRSRHDKLRHTVNNEGTYDRILDNIANCIENGFGINVRINLDKDDINAFVDVLNELDSRKLTNKLIVNIAATRFFNKERMFDSKSYSDIYVDFYDELAKRGYWESLTLPAVHSASCYMFSRRSINIAPNGDYVPCIEEIGDYSATATPIGNINETLTPDIERFRNDCAWVKDIPAKCSDCRVLPLCFGGCPRERIGRTKFHMIPGCSMYKYSIERLIKIIGDAWQKINIKQAS